VFGLVPATKIYVALGATGTVGQSAETRGGGQGVVVFYGLAKPVHTPLIGPVQQP
jgi:hypothetical protein